ncbi:4-hydroxythreonine-4-phosphate dehydrogenase [Paucidesulfovibrio gracilis DSM 16080]|uniref:4-hydroxythreonine-4-phosphate dehydrogenase n=1 Tax=Paucidesulfovibrio gracilis DSM 16080 TaxID=1121449 RepID=A0A1T4WC09_9BACT|nr:4-hydroxythreonine-4-phosphate dehydrogenase PdxA [Paucidesulfovibrio gracilis]SKA74588.1 4-hydroxythreonine-4-phosphate dehydrogenase [Paucidesulfovibrio gracilis DSM 16080]
MQTILVTLGDPGGLGPELLARIVSERQDFDDAFRYLFFGPEAALKAHWSGRQPFWSRLDDPEQIRHAPAGIYLFEPPELTDAACPLGQPSVSGGYCAGVSLEWAVRLLDDAVGQGLCTCPLNKAMLQEAGFDFPGHTEFLAERLGVGRDNVCMHLGGPALRVSLVTTHPPLRRVADLITPERVLRCLELTREHLQRLGVDGPIAVCGLNPHAGESGKIGSEETDILEPTLVAARERGFDVAGPLPADTVFHFAVQGQYAAVLAMYHDQGLAPLKLWHFSDAVNVTLGLPYPRTSPDHGTGYDITGTGRAGLESMAAALDMVKRLVRASRPKA